MTRSSSCLNATLRFCLLSSGSSLVPLLLLSALQLSYAAELSSLMWERARPFPGPGRHHPVTFANETHAFFLSGTTDTALGTADFFMYDATADRWTNLTNTAPFPGDPFSFGYGVVLPEWGHPQAYLGLGVSGYDGALLSHWWNWDMQSHTWTKLADFPGHGRKHPAMVPVFVRERWQIHVGLGDNNTQNFNDWWSYDVAADTWTRAPDFPGTARHHPFYFGLGENSYVGLGHGPGSMIERDWYQFSATNNYNGTWRREADFASYDYLLSSSAASASAAATPITKEARVAGTQFAIELPLRNDSNPGNLSGTWGVVLSGDGDNHLTMPTGEFHGWNNGTSLSSSSSASSSSSSSSSSGRWYQLPPHPGPSRWAPGSWVMRGTAHAYFTSGYDHSTETLYKDVWRIDLSNLFTLRNVTSDNSISGDTSLNFTTDDEVEIGGSNTNTGTTASSGIVSPSYRYSTEATTACASLVVCLLWSLV